MDVVASHRVNSIYHSVTQLKTFGCLGLVVPFFGLLLIPIALQCWYRRRRLLKDLASGRLKIEQRDHAKDRRESVSTAEKLKIIQDSEVSFGLPICVGLYQSFCFLVVFALLTR